MNLSTRLGLVVVFGVMASSFSYGSQNSIKRPGIVGGQEVTNISQVPFIVQLHDQVGVECGGTVIGAQWILSAGHCSSVIDSVTILGGSINSGQGTALAVKNHFVHPKFSETNTSVSYDYMLIQLAKPIDFAATGIQPIALPDSDFVSRGLQDAGQMMTVAGWGDLGESAQNYPSILHEVQVPIIDQATANQQYSGALDQTTIAAGYPTGGKDACDGDSGGPMFTFDPVKKQNVLVGAVSFGQGCAEASFAGIYAKVSESTDWINQTMQQNP